MMTHDDGTLTERGEKVVQRFAALLSKMHGARPVRREDLSPEAVAVLDAGDDLADVLGDIMRDPALRLDMAEG